MKDSFTTHLDSEKAVIMETYLPLDSLLCGFTGTFKVSHVFFKSKLFLYLKKSFSFQWLVW